MIKRSRFHLARGVAVIAVTAAVTGVQADAGGRNLIVGDVDAKVTSTSIGITFRTSFPVRLSVELGTDDKYGLRVREHGVPTMGHQLVVRGLRPGTDYYYRVSATAGTPVSEPAVVRTEAIRPQPAATVGRVITLGGAPFFPILTWAQCAADVEDNLSLGVNVFMSYSPCGSEPEQDLVAEISGRALTLMPIGSALGTLGWHQPDEPDGYGIPPESLPSAPDAAQTAKLTFLTVTAHFSPLDGLLPLGREVYQGYFTRADVIGFDYYTFGHGCSKPYTGLAYTFDEHRELMKLVGKPTFQWMETGPLEGDCLRADWPQLTPERLAAQVWLAIAAGATGLGYFTHTWHTGTWERFGIDQAIAGEIQRQNAFIAALQPALLGEQVPARAEARSPVRGGARRFGGGMYVIAVNTTEQPTTATLRVKGLSDGERLDVWRETRTVKVRRGARLTDTFGPLQVHIYATR